MNKLSILILFCFYGCVLLNKLPIVADNNYFMSIGPRGWESWKNLENQNIIGILNGKNIPDFTAKTSYLPKFDTIGLPYL